MPTDLATLETIGLQEIPAWYREKYNVPSIRGRSRVGYTQTNWRKPRAAPMKTIEYNSNGGGEKIEAKPKTTTAVAAVAPDGKTVVTPETSMAGETTVPVEDPLMNGAYRAGLNSRVVVATTNGSSPVTPPNVSRFIDFERLGNASFSYKYDAPQTPTGNGPVRSRRLYESQAPNHEYSMSPESIPSMTNTESSFTPFSSLGGTSWSSSEHSPVNKTTTTTRRYSVADEDINAADDTLENLSKELAKFDNSEPQYRSISELLDSSLPEDRYGNLVLF